MSRRLREQQPQPEQGARMLFISPGEQDHRTLREVFSHSPWEVWSARSCREALEFLRRAEVSVAVVGEDLPDGDWKMVLKGISDLPSPPRLVVASRRADDRLWAEVLNLGGYDLLLTPFEAQEASRVCYQAWRGWRQKREVSAQAVAA